MAASPSPLPVLLAEPSQLTFDEVVQEDGVTVMIASAAEKSYACPLCGIPSRYVHSRYDRTLLQVIGTLFHFIENVDRRNKTLFFHQVFDPAPESREVFNRVA